MNSGNILSFTAIECEPSIAMAMPIAHTTDTILIVIMACEFTLIFAISANDSCFEEFGYSVYEILGSNLVR